MRVFAYVVAASFFHVAYTDADSPQSLTADKQSSGFEAWFNGKDLDGWEHAGNWIVEKGVISRNGKGGPLVYTDAKVPDDFDLRFEWKVAPGSNSGVYYRPTLMRVSDPRQCASPGRQEPKDERRVVVLLYATIR